MAKQPTIGGANTPVSSTNVVRTGPSTKAVLNSGTNIAPVSTGNATVFPSATEIVTANSVVVTSSANNSPADVVTVYSTDSGITVNSVNEIFNSYTQVDSGVSQIIPGRGVTISSTGSTPGSGTITINAASPNGGAAPAGANGYVQFNDQDFFAGDGNLTYDNTNKILNATNVNSNVLSVANSTSTSDLVVGNVATIAQLNVGAGANLGAVSSISISGGSNGQTLVTDGTGNLRWAVGAGTGSDYGNSNVAAFLPTYTGILRGNTLSVTGNISASNVSGGNSVTANYFVGNGSLLTGISGGGGSSISNGTSNVNIPISNGNITMGVTGNSNVVVVAGSGVVVTGALEVVGTAYAGNVYSNTGTIGASKLAGQLTTAIQPNITRVGTLTSLSVADTVTANYFSGNGSLLTGIVADTAQTVTDAAQSNITSVGTLTSLNVSGDITAGNVFGGNTVAANYFSGNGSLLTGIVADTAQTVTTASQPNITSVGTLTSLSVANTVTANRFSGNGSLLTNVIAITANTVTTASQPNITSVGTLTSLDVTGNIDVGNLNATNANVTDLFAEAAIMTDMYVSNTMSVTNFEVFNTGLFNGNIDMTGYWINNVGYPTEINTAASKHYVDVMVSTGLTYHQSVNVATTTTLDVATGGTVSYLQPGGASNGVGATLSTTGSYTLIDGVNVQLVGTRILVKNEANAAWNGVYEFTDPITLTRTTDADEPGTSNTEKLGLNNYFFVDTGNVNRGVSYVVNQPTEGEIDFGTTNIVFAQFGTAQVYSAGSGLTLTNTTFSINTAQPTITSVGTLTSLAVSGNTTTGNIYANSGTVGASLLTGTLTTAIQPNVTSVGTLTSLAVNGNVAAGNINGGNLVTANYFTGIFYGTANNATRAGTVTTNAQPNITSVGTLTSLSVIGNVTGGNANLGNSVTANYFVGNGSLLSGLPSGTSISNGSSNVRIPAADGNINMSVGGTSNVLSVNLLGANILGTVDATYFVGEGGNISNIQGANVSGAVANAIYADSVLTTLDNTSAGDMDVMVYDGNIKYTSSLTVDVSTGTVKSNFFSGNGSQLTGIATNIIQNGTSNVLIPSNNGTINFTSGGNTLMIIDDAKIDISTDLNLYNGNIRVYGGDIAVDVTSNISAGNVIADTLFGDGGNITNIITNIVQNGNSNVFVPSPNSQINFTSGGNTTMIINDTSANIIGDLNATGNVSATTVSGATGSFTNVGGSLTTSSQPNITSVGILNSLDVANNITTSDSIYANSGIISALNLAGDLTTAAQPNITSVGTLTRLDVTGNITTGGAVTATGNITGNYFFGNGSQLTGIISSFKPSNLLYVAKNGNDTTGTGSMNAPYLTLQAAITAANVASAATSIILAPGNYSENITITDQTAALNISGGGLSESTITGNILVSGTSNNIEFDNLRVATGRVTHSATGYLSVNNVRFSANTGFTKTSTNITKFYNVDLGAAGTGNVLVQAGRLNFTNGQLFNLVVSGASTEVNVLQCDTVLNPTISAGSLLLADSIVSSLANTGANALTATGGTVSIKNSIFVNPNRSIGKISIGAGASYSYGDSAFDIANSVISGTAIVVPGQFQSINATGNISSGNANLGNSVTANYFVGNGSFLTGVGNAQAIVNGNSNVNIATANGNITMGVSGNSGVMIVTGTGANINGTANVTGNISGGNLTTLGTLSANIANVTNFNITGNITGNLLPTANITYNLGSPTQAWKDLYLSNSTIYLGNSSISAGAANSVVFSGNLQTDGNITANANVNVAISTSNGSTIDSWTFSTTGNLVLPTTTLGTGLTEQATLRSQRKIIPGSQYSATISGATPTVVYVVSGTSITTFKATIVVQHIGLGYEMFDVSALDTGADTLYTVSNRLNSTGQADTTVVVSNNGLSKMQITLTVNSGATTSYVTYDSTEFGSPQ